ncbi:MAG: DUF72 domain-containing protein [bacterium]|nr:DUF72 domain-containing protein [bacterium]
MLKALKEHNTAFCIFDINGIISPKETTTDFVYIRLDDPNSAYQSQYDDQTLSGLAAAFSVR